MLTSESPVSGNKYAKGMPRRELVHNLAREKSPDLPVLTSNGTTGGRESDQPAKLESKQFKKSPGEEALADNVAHYSPPSFGSNKDSDYDNSDNGNAHVSNHLNLTLSTCV